MLRQFEFILLLIMCLNFSVSAQYFNNRAPLHSFQSELKAVVISNSKYYTIGQSIDSSNDLHNRTLKAIFGLKFCSWDFNGNLLRDTVYQRSDGGDFNMTSNRIIVKSNNEFIVCADGFDTSGHMKMMFGSFDSLGHNRWLKEFDKPICQGIKNDYWRVSDFQQCNNHEWVVLSCIKCDAIGSQSYVKMMLSRFDSSFNIIWQKTFGDEVNNSASGHFIRTSSGYIISGCKGNDNYVSKNYRLQTELFRLDTAGNTTWHWLSDPGKLANIPIDIIQTKDSCYVFCGQGDGIDKLSQSGDFSTVWWYPTIDKIDRNGNLIWHRKISYNPEPDYDYNMINVLHELSDSNIMAAGQIIWSFNPGDSSDQTYGVLLKLNKDGSDIWKRKYQYQKESLIYRVYDMKQTPDGGFIMAGSGDDEYFPYTFPRLQGWIFKVDSNGCSSNNDPQCWPLAVPPTSNREYFEIFPNPATGKLFLKYNSTGGEVQFVLTNMYGQMLIIERTSSLSGQHAFDISKLASGVYSYSILRTGIIVQQGKIVVR